MSSQQRGPRHPPAYSVAAQMARLHRLGRAHSHEGVTTGNVVGFYQTDDGKFNFILVFFFRISKNDFYKTVGVLCHF